MLNKIKELTKILFRLCGLDIRCVKRTEYNYGWLVKRNIATVLDIGANKGQFAMMIHKILPHATIFSFEPIEKCYNKIVKKMIKVPNFRAFNYALGDTDASMEMHVNDFTPSSSLLQMTGFHVCVFPFTAKEHMEEVRIKRLDTIAQELSFNGNLLVKIDVQGYEDKVIEGGQSVISRAKVLIVETSFQTLYVGQPLFEDIYDVLKKMDFRFVGTLEQSRSPLDGSVVQADSIFMKRVGE